MTKRGQLDILDDEGRTAGLMAGPVLPLTVLPAVGHLTANTVAAAKWNIT